MLPTEFAKVLDLHQASTRASAPSVAEAAQRFLNPDSCITRYVVGRNPESERLRQLVPLAGLLDDGAPAGAEWQGLPVLPMRQVPVDAWVLNASTSIAPFDVANALARAGLAQTLTLADLLAVPSAPPGLLPSFIREQRVEIAAHRDEWVDLYQRLEDAESRQVLADVLRFRLTADATGMSRYRVRFKEQYFEKFLDLHDETFVDAGGFDGDTTEEFCKRVPGYSGVYFFEPSPVNMAKAQSRLSAWDRIDYHPIGLSDERAQLRFDALSGSASAVSDFGTSRILVDCLDHLEVQPPGFLKLDLEGWEMNALRGAAQTIRRHRPKLAISVYHQASHFREVAQLLLDLCPRYKVRLRHYTQGWSETVMFFSN